MKKQAIRLMPYSDGTLSRTTNGSKIDAQRVLRQARPVVGDLQDDFRFCAGAFQFRRKRHRLPAGSMASSSFSNNSNSRQNFGLSTCNAGSESGIWFSTSIRRAANWS